MLRSLLRRPRSIRVPLQNGPVDIQRVEVTRKPRPLFTRFFATFFISYCVIRTTTYLLSDELKSSSTIVNSELEKVKKTVPKSQNQKVFGDHWTKQHEQITTSKSNPPAKPAPTGTDSDPSSAETDTIHLTLPVWFRQKKGNMYKESDPEWQAFAKLQEDKKRSSALKMEVARMIGQVLNKPQHVGNLRHIRFTHSISVTLEIVPPIFSPEIYEAPCIFVSPRDVSVGWRPLPEAVGRKMERIFHPAIFAKAFFAGMREFSIATFVITRARLVDRFNQFKKQVGSDGARADGAHTSVAGQSLQLTQEQRTNMRFPNTQTSEKEIKLLLPFLRGKYGEEGSRQKYRDVVRSMTYQNAIDHACTTFNSYWISSQFAALQREPRGACQIRGHVDCMGERGRYRLEVVAVYLPSENAFVGRPIIQATFVILDLPKWAEKKDNKVLSSPVPPPQSVVTAVREKRPSPDRPTPPPPRPAPETPSPGKDVEK